MPATVQSFDLPLVSADLKNPSHEPGAVCRGVDPEMFFPAPSADWADAAMVCAECPLRTDCGQWGIATRQSGVWGGVLLARGRPVLAPKRWRNPYPVRKAG